MNCKKCPNRKWEKTEEDKERQQKICLYCEKRRMEGHSCMGGHK